MLVCAPSFSPLVRLLDLLPRLVIGFNSETTSDNAQRTGVIVSFVGGEKNSEAEGDTKLMTGTGDDGG